MKYLKVSNIKLKANVHNKEALRAAEKVAGVSHDNVIKSELLKVSLDARDKAEIHKIFTVLLTVSEYSKKRKNVIVFDEKPEYRFTPKGKIPMNDRPVIVGFGPAGMFCGYMLAKYGYNPIIIERGSTVDVRTKKNQAFWSGEKLDEECNVQFGEGGAGTFSDGKLNTGIKDKMNRIRMVLETFVDSGADEKILYDSKPHIGTDILAKIALNMRNFIKENGGTFHFDTKLTDIEYKNEKVTSITLSNGEKIVTKNCVLAIGHSARDTFEMLYNKGIIMEQKPFAVGVRVEHLQKDINKSQYGVTDDRYGAADYKLTYKANDGRGVYSFCMCPGGYVVNSSSNAGETVVNGMSYSKRDGNNANSAIVTTVTKEDYPSKHPLAGVEFQRELERKAFKEGNGLIPVQRYGDFKSKKITEKFGRITPETKGEIKFADINKILPEYICNNIKEGMDYFSRIIKGFNQDDVVLSAVESRTSSPVRIIRNDEAQCNIIGIYPAGEGAGYAGGITSAAIDGIKIFEKIAEKYAPNDKNAI